MNKKGSEMSMGLIIMAAIAILVLIILAVLILRSGNRINTSTGCTGTGGRCYSSCSALMEDEGGLWTQDVTNSGTKGGCKDTEVCCITVGGAPQE